MTEIIRRYHIMLPAQRGDAAQDAGDARRHVAAAQPAVQPDGSDAAVPSPQHAARAGCRRRGRREKLRRLYWSCERLVEVLPQRIMQILEQVQRRASSTCTSTIAAWSRASTGWCSACWPAPLLGSSLLLSRGSPPLIGDISIFGAAGCSFGLAIGLRLFRAINKSGHFDRRE